MTFKQEFLFKTCCQDCQTFKVSNIYINMSRIPLKFPGLANVYLFTNTTYLDPVRLAHIS